MFNPFSKAKELEAINAAMQEENPDYDVIGKEYGKIFVKDLIQGVTIGAAATLASVAVAALFTVEEDEVEIEYNEEDDSLTITASN